jgi:Leucine Rich repeat
MATLEWRQELARALSEGSTELDLDEMSLGDDGAAEVADGLRGSSFNNVDELSMAENMIGDAGASALAELLRSNPPALGHMSLADNLIGQVGVTELSDALRVNTTVRYLYLAGNKGVDDSSEGGSKAEAAAGIASLVAAIGVNTTLDQVHVYGYMGIPAPHQQTIDAALADSAGRASGREQFLAGPLTKAAHKR